MEALGIIPMIEFASCPSGSAEEGVQLSTEACDDIPCNCNCDCYDCVEYD